MTKAEIDEALAVCEAWEPWQMGDIEPGCVTAVHGWVVHRPATWDGSAEKFKPYNGPQFTLDALREIVAARLGWPTALRDLLSAWDDRDAWKREAMAARELLDRVGWGYGSRLGECATYSAARAANGE